MIKIRKEGSPKIMHRVITLLGREEIDFLDTLGKDALFSTGHKLSYNDILRGLIAFAMEAGISGQGINSADTLKDELLRKVHRLGKSYLRSNTRP